MALSHAVQDCLEGKPEEELLLKVSIIYFPSSLNLFC